MNIKNYTKESLMSSNEFLNPSEFLSRASVQDVKSLSTDLLNNCEEWENIINKVFTVSDLKAKIYAYSSKKTHLVNSFYQTFLSTVSMLGSISYGDVSGENWQSAAQKKLTERELTEWEELLKERKAKIETENIEHQARLKEMENPSTLQGYIDLYNTRGEKNLTDFQMSELDRLMTEKTKEKRLERIALRNNRLSIELENIVFEIVDTVHTQKNYDLFVVRFSEWVPRKQWLEAYERAVEFGGWYSGYDSNGAITGLQFKSEDSRRLFCESVLTGGEQLAEHIKEAKKLQAMNSSERFLAMAEKLEIKASANLEYKGLTNTARRAGIAADMENRARGEMALAQTMKNLSVYIKENPLSILAGIKYKTQLEELLRFYRNNESVRKTAFPVAALKTSIAKDLLKCADKAGAVMASSMINKRLKDTWKEAGKRARKKEETKTQLEIFKSLKIVINTKMSQLLANKGVTGGGMYFIADKYTTLSRLERMGLSKGYELRTALNELIPLIVHRDKENPIVKLERDLIGKKIPGFFPTPNTLINYMAEFVGINENSVVFEPSSGKGDILSQIQPIVKEISGIEINCNLVEICKAKKLNVMQGDFLDMSYLPENVDTVLMNPPFENKSAEIHFKHAHNLLLCVNNPLSIACIAPNNLSISFKSYLENIGATVENLPCGSFSKAFNSTQVSTCLITKCF